MPDGESDIARPTLIGRMQARDADRWDSYVASHRDGSFFHRAGWKTVIERSFGQDTYYLFAERAGRLTGVLPLAHYRSKMFGNALISNGCCMGGGPLADDEDGYQRLDDAATALMDRLGADYLEYRRPLRQHPLWARCDQLYATFDGVIASDEAENLKQIPRKQRAVLRKSLEAGLTDEIDADIDRFYPLYATTVHRLGTPVFAKSYFRALLQEFGPDCDIVTVLSDGKPVSSVLSFYFRESVMPYYAGAGDGARAVGANDFMYWRLMRRAAERGLRRFDFGRSTIGSGPYAFKKNWGFAAKPVLHEYRVAGGGAAPSLNPGNPKYRLMIALWKKMPLPLANLIGPHIVRNIG
jgi:FemAB-related protein (PEP-CTERM system-associated)